MRLCRNRSPATQHRRIIQGDDVLVTWQLARGEAASNQRVGLVRRTADGRDVWVRSVDAVGARSVRPAWRSGTWRRARYDLVLADRGGRRVLSRDAVYVYRAIRPADRDDEPRTPSASASGSA